MPKILRVRVMTDEERKAIEQLSSSRTAARQVERAYMIHWASQRQRVSQIATKLGEVENTVRNRINRFDEVGLPGICDEARARRQPTESTGEVSVVVATALTKLDDVTLPFGYWTLDRLEEYLNEHKGIEIKRSCINEIFQAEGLRWYKDEHCFGERVDPDFAKNRGSLPSSPRKRQLEVSS